MTDAARGDPAAGRSAAAEPVGAGTLSHVNATGAAQMVDVSQKAATVRVARAAGTIRMRKVTLDAIRANAMAKGDVLAVARVAAVLAAKRTADLIPLCHPLPLSGVEIAIQPDEALPGLRVEATVRCTGQTGVEMEALTAVSVCLLTIYDMAKGVDFEMAMGDIVLLAKSGGKNGP